MVREQNYCYSYFPTCMFTAVLDSVSHSGWPYRDSKMPIHKIYDIPQSVLLWYLLMVCMYDIYWLCWCPCTDVWALRFLEICQEINLTNGSGMAGNGSDALTDLQGEGAECQSHQNSPGIFWLRCYPLVPERSYKTIRKNGLNINILGDT